MLAVHVCVHVCDTLSGTIFYYMYMHRNTLVYIYIISVAILAQAFWTQALAKAVFRRLCSDGTVIGHMCAQAEDVGMGRCVHNIAISMPNMDCHRCCGRAMAGSLERAAANSKSSAACQCVGP